MHLSLTGLVLAAVGITAVAAQPDCTKEDLYTTGSGQKLAMPFRGSTIECELGDGNDSDAVAVLQEQINLCYGQYLPAKLKTDGDFGTKTKAAVVIVQNKAGASPDGRYGHETRTKMNWGVYFNGNPDDKVCKKLSAWN